MLIWRGTWRFLCWRRNFTFSSTCKTITRWIWNKLNLYKDLWLSSATLSMNLKHFTRRIPNGRCIFERLVMGVGSRLESGCWSQQKSNNKSKRNSFALLIFKVPTPTHMVGRFQNLWILAWVLDTALTCTQKVSKKYWKRETINSNRITAKFL